MEYQNNATSETTSNVQMNAKPKKPIIKKVWFWLLVLVSLFAVWVIIDGIIDPIPKGMSGNVYTAGKEVLKIVDSYLDYSSHEIVSKENAAKKIGEVIKKFSLNDSMKGKDRTVCINIVSLQTSLSSDFSRESIISSRNSLAKHLGKDAWQELR